MYCHKLHRVGYPPYQVNFTLLLRNNKPRKWHAFYHFQYSVADGPVLSMTLNTVEIVSDHFLAAI